MPNAMNDAGKPVDWWFLYKVSSKSETTTGDKPTGCEYVYFDSEGGAGSLSLSPHRVSDDAGALYSTVRQVLGKEAKANKNLGWYFYNDENPINGKVVSSRGHTKGILAFDMKEGTAFWLVQSTPKFPKPGDYAFPETGTKMAQTMLCVTLKDADTALAIAKQMYACQQPNVYAASAVPLALQKSPHDYRVLLINNQIAKGTTPVTSDVPFTSKAGQPFRAIAKNKYWGQDFYNDLVGPRLHENLEVETWEHDPVPPPADSDKVHKVTAMKEVDLTKIGAPYSWSEEVDHAKLAISDPSEAQHWVAVGDINYTLAQRKRGGGTVAFLCDPLWQSLKKVLTLQEIKKTARRRASR